MSERPSLEETPLHECDDQLVDVLRQFYDATLAPRFQVIVAQGFVELLVNAVIDARCKNAKKITANSRDFPLSIKLLLLHELGEIPDDLYKSLDQLRKIRNQAAHDPFFSLSSTVVQDGRAGAPLHEYCIGLILRFYNQHSKILGPLFAPTVQASGGGIMVFPTGYRTKNSTQAGSEVKPKDEDGLPT